MLERFAGTDEQLAAMEELLRKAVENQNSLKMPQFVMETENKGPLEGGSANPGSLEKDRSCTHDSKFPCQAIHERDFRKSTEKLLLIAQSEKQKYSDKALAHPFSCSLPLDFDCRAFLGFKRDEELGNDTLSCTRLGPIPYISDILEENRRGVMGTSIN